MRRQSVMRARRESTASTDHVHHGSESDHKPHPDDDDDDDQDEDNGEKPPINGIGTGLMRYQYMTPDDFGDDIAMGAADILKAFKGLSSTHGIPHVSDARGKHIHCTLYVK